MLTGKNIGDFPLSIFNYLDIGSRITKRRDKTFKNVTSNKISDKTTVMLTWFFFVLTIQFL
jgi:preprotein translocase subunit SecG